MKNLKLGILACGLVCLVLLVTDDFGHFLSHDLANALLFVVAFGAPTAMGVLGLVRPPLPQWGAIVATSGFATAIVKLHLWDRLSRLGDASLSAKISALAMILGLLVSIAAIAVPEEKA